MTACRISGFQAGYYRKDGRSVSECTLINKMARNPKYEHYVNDWLYCIQSVKGKVIPLQAWSGPEGSRKLRFTDTLTTAQEGGKVVSLRHRSHLPSGNPPGTHFC